MYSHLYEFTLEEIIENTLSEAFSLKGDLLKDYLIKRYMLLNKIKDTKNIDINSFSKYICDLLYLDTQNNKFKYYDIWLPISSYFEDSISNIVSNWEVLSCNCNMLPPGQNTKAKIAQINSYCSKVIELGNRKSKKICEPYKKYYYADVVLSDLNSSYKINPKFPDVQNIGPLKEKAFSCRTYEDVCKAYINAMLLDSTEHNLVLEKDIETFIYRNYQKYFPGTHIVGRQKEIGCGYFADIILSDEKFNYILEIKNKKDDRLYWQAVNYYRIYSAHSAKPVKIITIAPEYSEEMKSSLKTLKYVEVMQFSLRIEQGKITELRLENA